MTEHYALGRWRKAVTQIFIALQVQAQGVAISCCRFGEDDFSFNSDPSWCVQENSLYRSHHAQTVVSSMKYFAYKKLLLFSRDLRSTSGKKESLIKV